MSGVGFAALLVGAFSLAIALFSPFVVRPMLERSGVIDMPNERSSHQRPTIRGMGITTALATVSALILAVFMPQGSEPGAGGAALLLVIAIATAAAASVGWLEDIRGLGIKTRAGLQLAIGAVATAVVALLDPAQDQLWWIPAGAVAVAAFINVTNFMDGINGISGVQGFLMGGFYAYAGYVNQQPWLIYVGIAVGFAFAGFLPWNLGKNNVFLGDVGSYLLGAAISVTALAAFLSGISVEYVFSPVLIYLADTFVTFLRRLRAGERVYSAHRTHAYQRLTDAPMSHIQATSVVAVATILVSVLGIVAARSSEPIRIGASILCVLVVFAYLKSPGFFSFIQAKRSGRQATHNRQQG